MDECGYMLGFRNIRGAAVEGDTSANTTLETTLAGTEGWTQGGLSSSFTRALWFATHGVAAEAVIADTTAVHTLGVHTGMPCSLLTLTTLLPHCLSLLGAWQMVGYCVSCFCKDFF